MQLSRRQFLKYCAAGAATVPLLQMGALGTQAKAARAPLGEQLINAVTASPFNSLPSNLPLGAPLADISMGWDGTVWGVDRSGVPCRFDQLTQEWEVYGSQFSAVTYVSKWKGQRAVPGPKFPYPLAVRGAEVSPPTGAPIGTIGDMWGNLPDSFQLGLDGAAEAAGVLYLFRHGRYVPIDDATGSAGAPVAINTFTGWPATPNWSHGAFDAIGSNAEQPDNPQVVIWSNGEFVIVDMVAKQVVDGPHDLAWFVAGCNIYKALPGQPEAILVAYLSTATMIVWMMGLAAPPVAPLVNTLLSALSVYAYVDQYQATNEPPLTLSRLIVAAFPGIVNLIKFANFPVGLIAPAADLACRLAAAGIQMAQTIKSWDTLTEQPPAPQLSPKQFFPFVAQGA